MIIKILASVFLILSIQNVFATDLSQSVSGEDVEDVLGNMKTTETSPYLSRDGDLGNEVEAQKIPKNAVPDFVISNEPQDLSVKNESRKKLDDFGYTIPGSFESKENYIDIDKKEMATEFRKHSDGAFNIAYIKNDYSYESRNDIINRTIGEGYKHVKGGNLLLRIDNYFLRRNFVNLYWSGGAGLGYNSGRGLFVTGDRSDTTFKLWEVPVDLGLGVEIPIYHWFKISGTAGPSVIALFQNRNDFEKGEKGKNKSQWSYGQFANAQFKINLAGFSDEAAYNLFTESKITNLFMNLEVRYQNYANFQDDIKLSGTSLGLGFTFEYL